MKNLEIVIEDNVFVTTNKSIVDTRFYISYNDICFPSNKWTDFTFPILEEWKYNLIVHLKYLLKYYIKKDSMKAILHQYIINL